MFSSLEALDAEDNLQATPVTRQGAFQPKAKPRARKGSAPASKAKSFPPPASNASDQHEKNRIDVAKLQATTEQNIESQSIGATTEDFNKVSIETQPPTHSSALTDASLIYGADPTESERNVNFDAAVDCQAGLAWHEPTSLAEVSVIETPQSGVLPLSQALSEQEAIGSLSTSSQVDGLGFLTPVPHDPSFFEELIASYAFKPVEPSVEHVPEVEVPIPPSAFDELLASHSFKSVERVIEHAAEAGMQLVSGTEDFPSSVATETAGVSASKKKRPHKERQDDSPLVDQNGQVLDEGALVVEKGTILRSEEKPEKKRKGSCDEANKQPETVSGEATMKRNKRAKRAKVASLDASAPADNVAQETMQEEIAAEPAKTRKKATKQTQVIREEDGSNTIAEASSSKKKKGSTFTTNTFQSAGELALQITDAKESAQEALNAPPTKQETQIQVEEQQDSGEAQTSLGTSKRTRKKPARFLDGADDDEENITLASMKAISEAAKKKGRQMERKDTVENDPLSELFPNLPEKISKLKESKLATSTPDATTSQPPTKMGRKAHKPATPTVEENPKKKFKKCVQQRRRVDRRAINPADPDLDPKKMTMKDIIRLAEAKERMLKDNAKKENDGNNQVTANEPEREPESYESTCLAPQVQIVDGQIVINEQSLVINAHQKDDIRSYKRVEETHAKLNYHSYMKRTPTHTWRPDETELFYQALREFGTNFSMIQHLFPGRTRKQVVLKFKKEERCSPLRINEAMRVKPCDTSHFLEVMSSLNLLSSEIPEELKSGEGSAPMELSSSKKETEDKNHGPEGGERRKANGAECALKLDESSVHSMNQGNNEKSSSGEFFNSDQPNGKQELTINSDQPNGKQELTINSDHPNGNQELTAKEPNTSNEEAKPCESPKKAPSPPRKKKSLFSYQTSAAKS